MKTWIDSILNSKEIVAMPVMTNPGIEIIGKTVKEAVTDGNVHYRAIKALADKFHTTSCTTIMDLTVEAEAFGAEINMPEDEIPTVTGRLLNNAEDIENLQVPDISKGRVPQYILAAKLAAENIMDKPIFGGCIGPYSLAGRLYDMSEIMVAIYIEPDAMLQLLGKCTEFLIKYVKAIKATGIAGIVLAEPAAGLLSNEECITYSSDFVKQIVDAVQDDTFTVILHNCGNSGQCTDAMIQSGANALHFGNAISMKEVLESCPPNILVMGNLNPVGVFKQGNVESVKKETLQLLNDAANYTNFVISSGCDIPPHTPEANIETFLQTVEEFNRNKS